MYERADKPATLCNEIMSNIKCSLFHIWCNTARFNDSYNKVSQYVDN